MRARARRWVWGLGLSVLLLGGALTAGHPVLETFLIVQSPAARADALVVMAGSRELRVPTALRRFQEGLAPAGAEPLELGVVPAQEGRPEPPTWERRRTLLLEAIKYLWYPLRYPRVTS
ncbi:MAG: hypothetical protein ACYDAI_12855 [Trichloromonadaceae bacterium]